MQGREGKRIRVRLRLHGGIGWPAIRAGPLPLSFCKTNTQTVALCVVLPQPSPAPSQHRVPSTPCLPRRPPPHTPTPSVVTCPARPAGPARPWRPPPRPPAPCPGPPRRANRAHAGTQPAPKHNLSPQDPVSDDGYIRYTCQHVDQQVQRVLHHVHPACRSPLHNHLRSTHMHRASKRMQCRG